jgi:hypothetical protein
MPVPDWTRVEPGIFHDFHNAWITELRNALNGGVLPCDYYALSEQHAGQYTADVLTLHAGLPAVEPPLPPAGGGTAVADAPPKVRRKMTVSSGIRRRRRTLAIRHVSGHRLIAVIEVVSPANKDRAARVEEFAKKVDDAFRHGIHVLLVDLFAPGPNDPHGMHGAVWLLLDDAPYVVPPGEPLTLASYLAGLQPEAYVEHLAIGASLPSMPLFLHPDWYVTVPLEPTSEAAMRGMPGFWRDVLEGRSATRREER